MTVRAVGVRVTGPLDRDTRCSSPVFLPEGSLTRETGLNTQSPGRTFEFWRERNKIRGRFIGGNGVVVAKLNGDGLLNRKPAGASPSVRMTASAATNLMITREPAFRVPSASLYSCNVVNIYGGKSDEGSQQN